MADADEQLPQLKMDESITESIANKSDMHLLKFEKEESDSVKTPSIREERELAAKRKKLSS